MASFAIKESTPFIAMGCDRKNRRNDAGAYVPDATSEGEPIWTVNAAAAGEADPNTGMAGRPDIIRVNVAGDEPTAAFGQPIRFEDLVVRTGAGRDGNTYAMFSASGVSSTATNGQAPASGARPAGPAPASATGSNAPGRS